MPPIARDSHLLEDGQRSESCHRESLVPPRALDPVHAVTDRYVQHRPFLHIQNPLLRSQIPPASANKRAGQSASQSPSQSASQSASRLVGGLLTTFRRSNLRRLQATFDRLASFRGLQVRGWWPFHPASRPPRRRGLLRFDTITVPMRRAARDIDPCGGASTHTPPMNQSSNGP